MRSHWDIYKRPKSIEEAVEYLSKHGEDAAIIAGGTDLIVTLDQDNGHYKALIDITNIADLDKIRERDNTISIGACTTISAVEHSKSIQDSCPYLIEAIETIGSVQIRNVATLVGNVANASPAADGVPPLLVLDSDVVMISRQGKRVVPLHSFFKGPGKTDCMPDEMILEIQFKKPNSKTVGAFEKAGNRQAMAIALVNMAASITMGDGQVEKAHIALGAVAPTPVMATQAEGALIGTSLQTSDIEKASELAIESSSPIDDVRSGSMYRRRIVKALTYRGLHRIREQLKEAGEI